VAARKYVEASGRHYNGFVAAIIAARAAASAYSAPHGADASTTHSLIGLLGGTAYTMLVILALTIALQHLGSL
jgi:hypothetical protein